jgi:hypothetical protein
MHTKRLRKDLVAALTVTRTDTRQCPRAHLRRERLRDNLVAAPKISKYRYERMTTCTPAPRETAGGSSSRFNSNKYRYECMTTCKPGSQEKGRGSSSRPNSNKYGYQSMTTCTPAPRETAGGRSSRSNRNTYRYKSMTTCTQRRERLRENLVAAQTVTSTDTRQ